MWCMLCMWYASSRAPLGVRQVVGGVVFGTCWARGCAGVFGRGQGLLCWWILSVGAREFAGEPCVCRIVCGHRRWSSRARGSGGHFVFCSFHFLLCQSKEGCSSSLFSYSAAVPHPNPRAHSFRDGRCIFLNLLLYVHCHAVISGR